MAKTYLNTTKYMIKMKFEIKGIVDKPDIIGAIFGQSEGLLGDEMDLKELQKNGKLGRIEINHTTSMGNTKGDVMIPSSLDMAETSLLAAGVETVDKVGPCEAKFELLDIEDTRNQKRGEIKDRAKEILKKLMDKSSPDTQMLSDEIRENVRAADIIEYGEDKLPAGPDVESSNEIIVVEGRADVLNLLRNQIKNVVGMNGSNITKTLIDLTRKKTVTAFVDGDRGGLLNVRKLIQLAKVDFYVQAPDGKEVEELTRKEILLSLKRKASPSELDSNTHPVAEHREHREFREQRGGFNTQRNFSQPREFSQSREFSGQREFNNSREFGRPREFSGQREFRPREFSRDRRPQTRDGFAPRRFPREGGDRSFNDRRPSMGHDRRPSAGFKPRWQQDGIQREGSDRVAERRPFAMRGMDEADQIQAPAPKLSENEETVFKPHFDSLKGTMNAKILDSNNKILKEVKVKDVVKELGEAKGANAVVFDGVITKRLISAAEKSGAKYIIGAKKGKLDEKTSVKTITL